MAATSATDVAAVVVGVDVVLPAPAGLEPVADSVVVIVPGVVDAVAVGRAVVVVAAAPPLLKGLLRLPRRTSLQAPSPSWSLIVQWSLMGPGRYNRPAASATRVSTGYGTVVQLLLLLNDNLGNDPLLLMTVAPPKSYGRYTPPKNGFGAGPWSSSNDADERSVLVCPYDRIDRNVNGNATSGKLLVDELLLLLVVVLVVLLFKVPEILFVPPDAIESTLNKNVAGATPGPLPPSPSLALAMLPPPFSLIIIIIIIAVVAPDAETEVSSLLRVAIGLPIRADGLNFSDSTRSIPAKSENPLLNLRDPRPCCIACACCCACWSCIILAITAVVADSDVVLLVVTE